VGRVGRRVSYPGAMAGVAVVTDSTASLSRRVAIEAGVTVIPLQVVIDDASRPESEDAVTAAVVAAALRAGKPVTTSRPPPEAFTVAFDQLAADGYDAIVSVHLSLALSGTWDAAATAASSAPVPVTVLDSRTLAMATGFAVLAGAAAARAGAGPAEVAALVARRAAGATTYFYLPSLDHLRRGGRIGAAAALLGSALSVKPLLTVSDGEIRLHERVRTTSRALARLEELAVAAVLDASAAELGVDVAVHHLDDVSAAERVVEHLQLRLPDVGQVVVAEVSAVLAAHVGPGTLGIVVSPRD
jgi:DegV family protein with EDD domain